MVNHPEIVDSFEGRYKILWDPTGGGQVTNLEMAMNIMATKGWQASGGLATFLAPGVACVYALMVRIDLS